MQSEFNLTLRQWDRDQNSEPDWHHDELERIAGMVREGYTSGEIVGRNEEPGWWELKHADEGLNDRPAPAPAEGSETTLWARTNASGRVTDTTDSNAIADVWKEQGFILREYVTRPAPVAAPADATDEMVEAALAVDWDNEDERATVHNIWHAMRAKLPSSPAPAATDTGLETVGYAYLYEGKIQWACPDPSEVRNTALVTRSQATELLAAKDADIDRVLADNRRCLVRIAELEADKVTKDRLLKDNLDRLSSALGRLSWYDSKDEWRTNEEMFDFLIKRTEAEHMKAYALEAKLAAAEKVLERIAARDGIPLAGSFAAEIARAFLEGKPS